MRSRPEVARSRNVVNPLANKTLGRPYPHDPLLLSVPTLGIVNVTKDILCDFVGVATRFSWDCTRGGDVGGVRTRRSNP